MKKIFLLTFIFAIFYSNIYSQTLLNNRKKVHPLFAKDTIHQKGIFGVGLSGNFGGLIKFVEPIDVRTVWTFRGRGSYFLSPKFAIGGGLIYLTTYYTQPQPQWKIINQHFSGEVFGRYYPLYWLYAETSFIYGGLCYGVKDANDDGLESISTFGLGADVKLSRHVNLELESKYYYGLECRDCNITMFVFLGLNYYFNRK